jgi:hypothetical protein
MKSQKRYLPRFLAVLPELDFYAPGADPAGGGGGTSNPFDQVDFQLISSSAAHPGEIFDYTEMHVNSSQGGGTGPIRGEDDPERAIFVTGLPPVGAGWEMSVVFKKGTFSDTVKMKRFAGNFATLHTNLQDMIIFEEDQVFFMIQRGPSAFETYVNINMAAEVAQFQHTQQSTFNLFLVSILGRSN